LAIAGRVDAVVIHANNAWDMGAGIALARAAGAAVTDHTGAPYTLRSPNLLATTPGVHAALLSAVQR
jgi:myo-inositol-1(or 4)-monophosphatase